MDAVSTTATAGTGRALGSGIGRGAELIATYTVPSQTTQRPSGGRRSSLKVRGSTSPHAKSARVQRSVRFAASSLPAPRDTRSPSRSELDYRNETVDEEEIRQGGFRYGKDFRYMRGWPPVETKLRDADDCRGQESQVNGWDGSGEEEVTTKRVRPEWTKARGKDYSLCHVCSESPARIEDQGVHFCGSCYEEAQEAWARNQGGGR